MLHPIEKFKDFVACAYELGPTPLDACNIFWHETKNIRVRLKLADHHPDQTYCLNTVYGPLHFRDNFGDITNLPDLFHYNIYRSKALAGVGVILDVGANIGLAAAWFALHNPNCAIYCFEPLEANVTLISQNCPRAIVKQVAVGSRPGTIELQVDSDGVMASSIPCAWETAPAEFEVITLDDFVVEQQIERVVLLKVDVEGMENAVLEGARQCLRRTGKVAMETHGNSLHAEAISRLVKAGFIVDAEEFSGSTGMVFATNKNQTPHADWVFLKN